MALNLFGVGGGAKPINGSTNNNVSGNNFLKNERLSKVKLGEKVRESVLRGKFGKSLKLKEVTTDKNGKTKVHTRTYEGKEMREKIKSFYKPEIGRKISSIKNRIEKNKGFVVDNVKYIMSGSKKGIETRHKFKTFLDPGGLTEKERRLQDKLAEKRKYMNISGSRITAEELNSNREDPRAALKHNNVYSSDLGIGGRKYQITSEGKENSTDDFRGKGQKSNVLEGNFGASKNKEASFAQGGEGAASIASGIGAKPQEKKDNVIDVDFNKEQNSFNNDIMPRTGTDG